VPSEALEELKTAIRLTFSTTAEPLDMLVVCECEECHGLSLSFRGRSWQALSVRDVFEHEIALLSPEAFRYYLPAYLLAALDRQPESWDVRLATIHLLGASEQRMREYLEERFRQLSIQQVETVIAFLEYVTLTDNSLNAEAATAHEDVWEPLLRSMKNV
jgi:hypothetical protein